MKIGLIGATGNVGMRITAEAVQRGHAIVAVARDVSALEVGKGIAPVAADLMDPDAIAKAVAGCGCVILSVRFQGLDFEAALDSLRKASVSRLLIVGGAASLEDSPGIALIDTPDFPDFIKPEAEPARQALDRLRSEPVLDWTFISPSIVFEAGERTGEFRLGDDAVLRDAAGQSRISYEDFAVATIDEIERSAHSRRRFTVGY